MARVVDELKGYKGSRAIIGRHPRTRSSPYQQPNRPTARNQELDHVQAWGGGIESYSVPTLRVRRLFNHTIQTDNLQTIAFLPLHLSSIIEQSGA